MKNGILSNGAFGWKFIYPADNFYSCKDASNFLQVPLQVVYTLRKKGTIPFIVIQGMYFFEKHGLINWIMANQPERVIKNKQVKGNIFRVVQYYLNILIMFLR